MKQIFAVVALLAASWTVDSGQTISGRMFPKSEPADKKEAVQEILQIKRQYDEAELKNDFAWFDRMFVDDYTFILPDCTEVSKAQTIMDLKSGDLKLETAIGDEMRVRVYGDTAVVTGRFAGKGRYKGKPFSTLQRFTSVWIKRQARWQAITEHATEIAQK